MPPKRTLLIALVLVSVAFGNVLIRARTLVNLAVIRVIARNKNTGLLIENLRAEDFQVSDNGQAASIHYFRRDTADARHDDDRLALWLVFKCPQNKFRSQSSSELSHKSALDSVLSSLDSQDLIGVAHWCGNGDAEIDMPVTDNREAALNALKKNLKLLGASRKALAADSAFEHALRLLHANTRLVAPSSQPIIIFFGAPPRMGDDEVRNVTTGVIMMSAVVYAEQANGSAQPEIVQHLAECTGGTVFVKNKSDITTVLKKVVGEVHSRYLLAIYPSSGTSDWHKVDVTLSPSAKQKYPSAELGYASGYFVPSLAPSVSEEKPAPNELDAVHLPATSQSADIPDIPVKVEGRAFKTHPEQVQFTLRADSSALTWLAIPGGDRRAEVIVTVDIVTADGKTIRSEVRKFQGLRKKEQPDFSNDEPIVMTLDLEVPPKTARVRFLVRDVKTDRFGKDELTMESIASAPQFDDGRIY
jgi:hypothetical protein